MYLDHFGLRQAPFRITPHTEFFFAGAKRGATLEALIYAITHDEGIVKVSGEVGSGKTMLCRMLLEKLPGNVETVYLANPLLSRDEILLAIAAELRLALPDGPGNLLLNALQERLLAIYAAGRQVVVLIDEAHAMPPDALEEIRLLSNLESSQHKLLQIVLFGQPELDQRLHESAMRQLNDRITHSFRLEPLPRKDVAVYLMFRLRAAGYHGPDLFSRMAIQMISRASQGLTRRINILADKALLAAFSDGVHQVDGRQVRAAIRDASFTRIDGHSRWRRVRGIGAAAAIATVAIVAYLAGSHGSSRQAKPEAANDAARPTAANPAATGLPTTPVVAVASPAAPPLGSATTAVQSAAVSTVPVTATVEKPLTLAERMSVTEAWLKSAPDHHYFIQLLMADAGNQREVSDFIANNAGVLDLRQVRVYRTTLAGRERLGVIYGDYVSREQANAALAMLGEITPANRPYVRPVARLRSSGHAGDPGSRKVTQ